MAQEIGTVALIVSAGRGHRIGGETPKQYLPLGGHAILYQSIVAFLSHEQVDVVRVVIHPDDEKLYYRAIEDLDILSPVFGGAERQDSVRLGLQSLQELDPERVLIHDAARPWVEWGCYCRRSRCCSSRSRCSPRSRNDRYSEIRHSRRFC